MDLFRKKRISDVSATEQQLKRELGTWDLIFLGVGAIVGTGIFVLSGSASLKAGPSVILSFIIAAIVCFFAALTYAELASIVPGAGSVYAYAYVTMGELMAWLMGWNLLFIYTFVVGAVSSGWSGYVQALLAGFGIELPKALSAAPGTVPGAVTYFNLPAFFIVFVMTFFLSLGVKGSTRFNNLMVAVKLSVILLIILVGSFYVQPKNWTPFMPYGWNGVIQASALIFFAFLGFDAVSTAAEEAKDPERSVPKGILGSLSISVGLYILMTAVVIGILPYTRFQGNEDHPLAYALTVTGQKWLIGFVTVGTIVAMMNVIFVMLYGQTRIVMAISRDGLLPNRIAKIHPKYQTPFGTTWVAGLISGIVGGLVPLYQLAELVNLGMLMIFVVISIVVIQLRYKEPDLPRKFRCPFVPVVPILSIVSCILLMIPLSPITWVRFAIWIGIGLVIYFAYSRKHSVLNQNL